jgi:hypothetical protein
MNRIIKLLIAFYILPGLAGCGADDTSNESTGMQGLIEGNMALWKSSDIDSYIFTYNSSPNDCPQADPFPPKVITVENSVVVSVYVPDFGANIDIGDSPTIDDVFSLMAEADASNPRIFSVSPTDINNPPEFNQEYGFPVAYFIDVSESECDGTTYSISDFQ